MIGWLRGRIEIVTIVFEDDLDLLALQLISIAKLFNTRHLSRIRIVFNGRDNNQMKQTLDEVLAGHISDTVGRKLVFVNAEALCQNPLGWRGQQLLKLIIAKQVRTKFYLVLDAKNHFIKHCGVGVFFTRWNTPKTFLEPPSKAMSKLLLPSLDYFGVRSSDAIAQAMPTITPYIFYRNRVLSLMREVERREGISFETAFLTRMKQVSEFWLYYAWLLYSEWRPRRLYKHSPKVCQTLFATWPTDEKMCDWMIEQVDDPQFAMLGLHRLRVPKLTAAQRTAITERWRRAGLAIPSGLARPLTDTAPESTAPNIYRSSRLILKADAHGICGADISGHDNALEIQ